MKHLLPTNILYTDEFCKTCEKETEHIFVFMQYAKKKHTVTFYFYCSDCYARIGDSCKAQRAEVSVQDWVKFIRNDRLPGEEN